MKFERLADIVTITKGKKPILTDNPNSDSIRFLQIDDLRNDNNLKFTNDRNGVIATEEDILLAWDGANAGTVGYGKGGFIGSTIAVLKKKNPLKFNTIFLGKFLQSQFEFLRRNATGATIPHIDRKTLENLRIPILDIDDQIYAAGLLNKTEALITQRKETIELLNELLRSTFLKMFGNPIRNEKGWKKESLESLCLAIADIDHKMPKAVDTGFPFISAKDLLDNGTLSFENVKKISKEDFLHLSRKIKPKKGDIIYSRIGAKLGKARIVNVDFDFVVSYSCCTIRPDTTKINVGFLNQLLDSPYLLQQALKDVRAIGVPDLGMDKIRKFGIIVPPLKLQIQFSNIVEKIAVIKAEYSINLKELEILYEGLNHKVFNGELPKSKHKSPSLSINQKEEDYFKKRKALACYIINQSLDDDKFGDTKFEKLLNLSDEYAIKRNLGQQYYQKVAGPYDNAFTKVFYLQIERGKLFKRKRSPGQSKFIPAANHSKSFNATEYFSKEELERVDKLIKHFKKSDYEKPEIVSTLYAVWNNRIIRNQEITDEQLKADFLKWDIKKAKYRDRLDDALAWMRKENIIPDGWGKVIEKPKPKKSSAKGKL